MDVSTQTDFTHIESNRDGFDCDNESIHTNDTDMDTESYIDQYFLDRMTDDEAEEFHASVETLIAHYLEDHIEDYSAIEFIHNMTADITTIMLQDLTEMDDTFDVEDEDDVAEYVEECIHHYLHIDGIPPRSEHQLTQLTHNSSIECSREINETAAKIATLIAKPQPKQRTPEWYTFRHNLITASNIWKIFSTDAQQNSLIYEKCKPIDTGVSFGMFSSGSSVHWGVKYEPLTLMLYAKYNCIDVATGIADFGCIQHDDYACIGASPDGIVVDRSSPLFGRMLEIKNIVNREIDGIPSVPYWIQMQLQMETCGLDTCDFVETQIREYASVDEYEADTEHEKGVVLQFLPIDGNAPPIPVYKFAIYNELALDSDSTNSNNIETWIRAEIAAIPKLESGEPGEPGEPTLYLASTKYWWLDIYSCVTVQRNQRWFDAIVPRIVDFWKTIERERVTGYEHRAPKKRPTKGSAIQTFMKVNKLESDIVDENT